MRFLNKNSEIEATIAFLDGPGMTTGISEYFGFQGNDRTNIGPWTRSLVVADDIYADSTHYGYVYNPLNYDNVLINQVAFYLVNLPQAFSAGYPIEKMSD